MADIEDPQLHKLAEKIGAKVKARRLYLGLTGHDLAERTGINEPNIRRLERGAHVPSLHTLHRVAMALRTTIVFFFT